MEFWNHPEVAEFIHTVIGSHVEVPFSASGKFLLVAVQDNLLQEMYGHQNAMLLQLAIEAHKKLSFKGSQKLFKDERDNKKATQFYNHCKAGGRGSRIIIEEAPVEIKFDDTLPTLVEGVPEGWEGVPEGWEGDVERNLEALVSQMYSGSQKDEHTLARVFYIILGNKLSAEARLSQGNFMDALIPLSESSVPSEKHSESSEADRILVELKIGSKLEQAVLQLAVYETQRFQLWLSRKRRQNRVRRAFLLCAPAGFGRRRRQAMLQHVEARAVILEFPDKRPPAATVCGSYWFDLFPIAAGRVNIPAALAMYHLFRFPIELHPWSLMQHEDTSEEEGMSDN
eukprot:Gregarina_sp_Poly_1__11442@NODE_979_length_5480_cov_217_286902_g691_i0_p3_GENE_NODE_979_length_5480_cov_217_286902_g691_i0NODE_979_length_5480_cov_217_286902_g691_i0_p3_ORF_typecomplete_len341_score45_41DUF5526/PF17664_1/0_21GH115_C/PF17829_1/0_18_NODE_979_length_5480_cov_217_286902_g691_i09211943